MKVSITCANGDHAEECIRSLENSDIGRVYFSDIARARRVIARAIESKEVYVAVNSEGECWGFIWYMLYGAFGMYPYLHVIAVKEEYRSQGVGRQLMQYFEDSTLDHHMNKAFLIIDDFNIHAKGIYEKIGYQCIGTLPDFYKSGTSGILMMKIITEV